jgi:hypothetical protein
MSKRLNRVSKESTGCFFVTEKSLLWLDRMLEREGIHVSLEPLKQFARADEKDGEIDEPSRILELKSESFEIPYFDSLVKVSFVLFPSFRSRFSSG